MPEWMVIPDLPGDQQERRFHMQRYEYAASVLGGRRVLDCACGMGYGTDMLRLAGAQSRGVDIDPEAIEVARKRYPESRYEVGDIYTTPFDGYDALVCFETLEHLDDPDAILERLADSHIGEIIASVPIRPTVHSNHWHRTDFTPDSFRLLIGDNYEIVHQLGQAWSDGEDMYLMLHGKRLGYV